MENFICVYLHLNPDTKQPFYVGIGNIKRPYIKIGRSKEWKEYVQKYGCEISIFAENLSWADAIELEKAFIEKFGRVNIGTGILLNKTCGGEGQQKYGVWSLEELIREALKYKTRSEFCEKSNGAYKAAMRNKKLNIICAHMPYNRNVFKLTKEKCHEIAMRYNTKSELQEKNKSVYNKIVRERWGEVCFSHMKQKVDKEYCKNIANQFKHTSDLIRENKYIYNLITKNKWQGELFAHMTPKPRANYMRKKPGKNNKKISPK